jgi:hypothetical protein
MLVVVTDEEQFSAVSSRYILWCLTQKADYVSELRPSTGLLFIPGLYVSMESHGDDDAAGDNS